MLQLLLSTLLVQTVWGAVDYGEMFKTFSPYSSDSLLHIGRRMVLSNQPDSAMVIYSMIVSRDGGQSTRDDALLTAKALTNMGYVSAFCYHDFYNAYAMSLRAIDLCQQRGLDEFACVPYQNMGTVYHNYGDYDSAIDCYRKAYQLGLKAGNWNTVVMAFDNLFELAISQNRCADIEPDLQTFDSISFPSDLAMAPHIRTVAQIPRLMTRGDYQTVIATAERAKVDASSYLEPDRVRAAMCGIQAKAYNLMQQPRQAIQCLQQGVRYAQTTDVQDALCDFYTQLADLYADIGENTAATDYRLKAYELEKQMFSTKSLIALQRLKSTYQLQAKDEQLQAERVKQQARERVFAIAIIAAVLLIAALVVVIIRGRRQSQLKRDLYRKSIEALNATARGDEIPLIEEPELTDDDAMPDEETASATGNEPQQLALDDGIKRQIGERVLQVMSTSREIYQPDFSLGRLAELVDSKPRYVTQVISEMGGGKSFKQLLAEYRIKEACRQLADPSRYGKMTVEAIAGELGFKSRSNFSVVFKKIMGLSPSDFINLSRHQRPS